MLFIIRELPRHKFQSTPHSSRFTIRVPSVRQVPFSITQKHGMDNPAQKCTLKSLPGGFSGMHLVCLMCTGSRMIEPSLDRGIDFSKEYEEAEKLF